MELMIVTYKSSKHADDFFAICLVRIFHKDVPIEKIAPQDPAVLELKDRKNVILVAVGYDYNKDLLNFDPHHDQELPSSLLLVADYFNLKLDSEFVRGIDSVDSFGAVEGLSRSGISRF
jgi:hypothetical protein